MTIKIVGAIASIVSLFSASAVFSQGFEGARLRMDYLNSDNNSSYRTSVGGDVAFSLGTDFGVQGGVTSSEIGGDESATWYFYDAHAFYNLSENTRLGGFYAYESNGNEYQSMGLEVMHQNGTWNVEGRVAHLEGINNSIILDWANVVVSYDINDQFSIQGGATIADGSINPTSYTELSVGASYNVGPMTQLYGTLAAVDTNVATDTLISAGLTFNFGNNGGKMFTMPQIVSNFITQGY